MNKLISVFLITALISVNAIADTDEGVPSYNNWFELVDSGRYAESWDKAAPYFQSQITREQWVQALEKVRRPLGRVFTRKFTTSNPHTSLPGVPDGEYSVVTFTTSFEYKSSATETITLSKVDNDWRTVGYFIR